MLAGDLQGDCCFPICEEGLSTDRLRTWITVGIGASFCLQIPPCLAQDTALKAHLSVWPPVLPGSSSGSAGSGGRAPTSLPLGQGVASSLLGSAACNCPSTEAMACLTSLPVLAVLIWIKSALAPAGRQVRQQETGSPARVDIGRAQAGVRATRDQR